MQNVIARRVRSEMQRSRLNRKIQFPRTPNDATERGRGRQHPSNARSHPAKQRVPINGGATQPSSRTGPRTSTEASWDPVLPGAKQTRTQNTRCTHTRPREREWEGGKTKTTGRAPRTRHSVPYERVAGSRATVCHSAAAFPTDALRHADSQVTRTRMRKQAPTHLLSVTFVYKQAGDLARMRRWTHNVTFDLVPTVAFCLKGWLYLFFVRTTSN